jgi:hypothetical protein
MQNGAARRTRKICPEESDNFVFVASPDSAKSEECAREVAFALSFHKRIVPIVGRELDFSTLPPSIRSINALSFLGSELEAVIESLLRAFDTDLVWVHSHSRLEIRAAEWQSRGDDPSYLLRGSDLRQAESWLIQGSGKEVIPTEADRAPEDRFGPGAAVRAAVSGGAATDSRN